MPDHPHIDTLRAIGKRDPAGWENEPTQADYTAHKQWAIDTYGQDIWTTYKTSAWGLFGTDPV